MSYLRAGSLKNLCISTLCALIVLPIAARAERLVSSNMDSRMMVALNVEPGEVQKWLPDVWKARNIPKGPLAGANLFLVFIDRMLHLSADGKPAAGGSYRMAALVAPANNPDTGENALVVLRVYTPHDDKGPYGNSLKAKVSRRALLDSDQSLTGQGSENWAVEMSNGGALTFSADYEHAVPKKVKHDSKLYSSVKPAFYRIYRYEQLINVMPAAGKSKLKTYNFKSSIEELKNLFNGREKVIGVAVIPWYVRQTLLP